MAHVERAARPGDLETPRRRVGPLGVAAAAWGIGGHVALLAFAAWKLLKVAVAGLGAGATPETWILAAASVAVLGHLQGYRGFQRAFSPRVVARALHLARSPRPLYVALAPLHTIGLLDATRRRKVVSWIIVLVMPVLAVLVGRLPHPWRAIVDLGVGLGLAWGAVAMVAFTVAALAGRPPRIATDVPSR